MIKFFLVLIILIGAFFWMLEEKKEKDKYFIRYYKQYSKERDLPETNKRFLLLDTKEIIYFPNIKEDRKTILGVDKNNNKVRDDIEIWVDINLKNFNHRMAIKQYIVAQQEFFVMYLGRKKNNFQDMHIVYLKNEKAQKCIFSLMNYDVNGVWDNHVIRRIDDLYFNTNDRYNIFSQEIDFFERMQKKNKQLAGSLKVDENELINQCDFIIQDRERVLNSIPMYLKNKNRKNKGVR